MTLSAISGQPTLSAMTDRQRNAVWISLLILALPVGMLAGKHNDRWFGTDFIWKDLFFLVVVGGLFVAAALLIRAGGKNDT